jgi:hypothetical protein
MKKLLISVASIFLFTASVQAAELINLNTCSSYYDGCNTCSVENGKIGACTEMYCMEKQAPKCLKQITEPKKITNAQDLCEVSQGVYNEGNCEFNDKDIKAASLYSVYMDFTGQMMYM